MKKKICIILVIILVAIIVVGIITNYADSARITTGHEPKCCIKVVSNDGSKVTYWGLGYKVVRYVGVSPNEPYENNIGVKMGNWFMKYDLPEFDVIEIEYEGQTVNITDIKDIEIIENILLNSKYNNEICDGINTHKITLNNDVYYIKESCKEIQKEDKQATISVEDLETINNIISRKMNNEKNEKEYSFYGTVVESNTKYMIVEPNEEEEIRKSTDKISIGLGENNDYSYAVGTNVKIIYNGVVMETYPAQIEAIDIELKSAENFEVRFEDKSYESIAKVRTILDEEETDKYNYNIYAYMGEVNILIDGKEMPLRDALLKNKITMDEIIAKANQDLEENNITGDMYKDGGSMIYQYSNYTIIKYHTLDGNRDVYIGIKDMKITDLV